MNTVFEICNWFQGEFFKAFQNTYGLLNFCTDTKNHLVHLVLISFKINWLLHYKVDYCSKTFIYKSKISHTSYVEIDYTLTVLYESRRS